MTDVVKLLGDEAKYLLEYKCKTIQKEQLNLPGPDFIDNRRPPRSDRCLKCVCPMADNRRKESSQYRWPMAGRSNTGHRVHGLVRGIK